MYKIAGALLATAMLGACAAPPKQNAGSQQWYSKANQLRAAYKDCLQKNGNNPTLCKKQRSDYYEQMEWDLLEESD